MFISLFSSRTLGCDSKKSANNRTGVISGGCHSKGCGLCRLELSLLGELLLLGVDSLGDDLVPGALGLHELEPLEVVESRPGGLHLHALGPGALLPLLGDLVGLPLLADHAGLGGEGELHGQRGQVQGLDPGKGKDQERGSNLCLVDEETKSSRFDK